MSINWYPGHMHKARKEIIEKLSAIDVLIEVVDARLPYSSQNPVIAKLRHNKPTVIVLNKCDLADPEKTQQWQTYYTAQKNIKTLACQHNEPQKIQQISNLCRKLVPEKENAIKALNAMILGIPNVGKSTIINVLAGKNIASTGNEPAVTKRQQKIHIADNIILHDTPGILWPKIANPHSGYRLAISGAIKNTAMEYEDVGFYAVEFFAQHYPRALQQRYQLNNINNDSVQLLEAIATKRGAKQAGGKINLHKTCEILLHDFRHGSLGNITLESPEKIEQELEEVTAIEDAKKLKKANRKNR